MNEQLVQRDISQAQQQVAIAGVRPTVSLQGQYELLKEFDRFSPGINNGYSAAVVARWQFADGGQAKAQVKQQVVNQKIAESRYAQTHNTIRLEVEQAYNSLVANRASLKTTALAARQANESLQLAIARFQAGVGTQTERIEAETDLTRAQGNYVSAVLGYNRAIAQLERAIAQPG